MRELVARYNRERKSISRGFFPPIFIFLCNAGRNELRDNNNEKSLLLIFDRPHQLRKRPVSGHTFVIQSENISFFRSFLLSFCFLSRFSNSFSSSNGTG